MNVINDQFSFNNSLLVVLDFYQRFNCFIISVVSVDEFLTDEDVSHLLKIDISHINVVFQIAAVFEIKE